MNFDIQSIFKKKDILSMALWEKQAIVYDFRKMELIEELRAEGYEDVEDLYRFAIKQDKLEWLISILNQYDEYYRQKNLEQQKEENATS